MRIFIFELTTGGGLLETVARGRALTPSPATELASLAHEGAAMVEALASDFAALPEVRVVVLRDGRMDLPTPSGVHARQVRDSGECLAAFDQEAARADWTIVIAPEFQGMLATYAARTTHCGGRLLGPGAETIRLAGDKQRLAVHLARAGLPVPAGTLLPDDRRWPTGLSFPVVLKPRDGAGSQGIHQLYAPLPPDAWPADPAHWRVEEYRAGLAVSVAFLCGSKLQISLPPCAQLLSEDGQFQYLGGRLPLMPSLAERASRLAAGAVATLPDRFGYLGVDLVLGPEADGRDDVVIEVNPRLTTSYVGLRVAARENLAAAMLAIANGEQPIMSFASQPIEFRADGTLLK